MFYVKNLAKNLGAIIIKQQKAKAFSDVLFRSIVSLSYFNRRVIKNF